ncbi:CRISPR-associated endonuclease Cas2 [Venenivibrio stagnispumantis]|uniref:CRISPR-associated endoribonuclease Cas2 n=1 Tax=Venenivibrio stagnispumantis TaxID=407998 RepID=A0AA45WNS2_9AQUI|nr:CRISPR-associated endonuclease Cas2 [Venenivibrio stagnispumantis]MCW4573827.1 CRISPR-associated endonuclease Cas2 [Venenivibrio stagnispumantis]SMP18949.1 CRISPR-associated protein, Cas2 family [Venenivibrio stagnispumantis]
MYVIITYDITDDKRLNKVRKILRKYLYWTQLSTFEGEISEGKLSKCMAEVNNVIEIKEDSVYVYKVENPKNLEKNVLGIEKGHIDNFL